MMHELNSSGGVLDPEVCPEYQSNYRGRTASPQFFALYSAICLMALAGNGCIIGMLGRNPKLMHRRTFRFLTLVLSGCELTVGLVLLALLFRIGVGYRNRTAASGGRNSSPWITADWAAETENAYEVRRLTLLRVLLSLRDFAIGAEIYVYSLLAADRLLAIAVPTAGARWNCRVVRRIVGAGFIAMATVEIALQVWRWTSVLSLHGDSHDAAACALLSAYSRANTLSKAVVAVFNYLVALSAYTATGTLLLARARSRQQQQRSQRHHETVWPLLGLAIGNLVQFVSLLPMVLENLLLLGVHFSLYYCFFVSSAAVPCLTVAFNSRLRRALLAKLPLAKPAQPIPHHHPEP